MSQTNWPVFISLLLAFTFMLVLNYFFRWALIPDLVFVVLLQWLLHERTGPVWWFVLPLSLLLDLAGQMVLGFHGMVYAMMAIFVIPIATFWSRGSLLEQFILLVLMSVGFVVLRALATYILMDVPAPTGWYWPIFTQIMSWPFILMMREALLVKFTVSKRS